MNSICIFHIDAISDSSQCIYDFVPERYREMETMYEYLTEDTVSNYTLLADDSVLGYTPDIEFNNGDGCLLDGTPESYETFKNAFYYVVVVAKDGKQYEPAMCDLDWIQNRLTI